MGKGWVLCDGRDVSNSEYHKLLGNSRIPDCRSAFLRTAGNHGSELGERQADATSVNGIQLTWTDGKIYTDESAVSWDAEKYSRG